MLDGADDGWLLGEFDAVGSNEGCDDGLADGEDDGLVDKDGI